MESTQVSLLCTVLEPRLGRAGGSALFETADMVRAVQILPDTPGQSTTIPGHRRDKVQRGRQTKHPEKRCKSSTLSVRSYPRAQNETRVPHDQGHYKRGIRYGDVGRYNHGSSSAFGDL